MSARARIAVIGSRKFPSAHAVKAFVAALPDDSLVVSGGAAGVVVEKTFTFHDRMVKFRDPDGTVYLPVWQLPRRILLFFASVDPTTGRHRAATLAQVHAGRQLLPDANPRWTRTRAGPAFQPL